MRGLLEALALCMVMAVGAGCVTAESPCGNLFGTSTDALRREMDAVCQKLYGTWSSDAPVGMALLVSDGRQEQFLTSHLPDDFTPDSHYRIASLTKTFTAAAVLMLVQEGKIRLDDVITASMPGRKEAYVPRTREFDIPYKNQITIRQLLQHMSGIYDVTNDTVRTKVRAPYAGRDYVEWQEKQDSLHRFTAEELIGVQSRHRLAYAKPGEDEHYSNVGFALLTLIVERAARMDYQDFVRRRLLQPNELKQTSLVMSGADWKLPEPFLRGYRWRRKALEEVTERNASAFIGSGNMISTLHDVQRWLRRLNEGQCGLRQEMVSAMQDCNEHDYGLGTRRLLGRAYGHNSHLRGYFGCGYYDRQTGLSWVIVFNAVSNIPGGHGRLLKQFQRRMLELYDAGR